MTRLDPWVLRITRGRVSFFGIYPNVQLTVPGESAPYIARQTEGAERAALFEQACLLYPGYRDCETQTAGIRQIPVIALRPAARRFWGALQGSHRRGPEDLRGASRRVDLTTAAPPPATRCADGDRP